jgi:hypothetical protein
MHGGAKSWGQIQNLDPQEVPEQDSGQVSFDNLFVPIVYLCF